MTRTDFRSTVKHFIFDFPNYFASVKKTYSNLDETAGYQPVDAVPETQEDEIGKSKRGVRKHYNGVNPEVEAELQKVIDEIQEKQAAAKEQTSVA